MKTSNNYKNVVVLQDGPAQGHTVTICGKELQVEVDHITRQQVVKLCNAKPKGVKVKAGHEDNVFGRIGKMTNFSNVGNRTLADFELSPALTEHEQRMLEEIFRDQPDEYGFSLHFDGQSEMVGPVAMARVNQLFSVDLVNDPATTSGLFTRPEGITTRRFSRPVEFQYWEATSQPVGDEITQLALQGARAFAAAFK